MRVALVRQVRHHRRRVCLSSAWPSGLFHLPRALSKSRLRWNSRLDTGLHVAALAAKIGKPAMMFMPNWVGLMPLASIRSRTATALLSIPLFAKACMSWVYIPASGCSPSSSISPSAASASSTWPPRQSKPTHAQCAEAVKFAPRSRASSTQMSAFSTSSTAAAAAMRAPNVNLSGATPLLTMALYQLCANSTSFRPFAAAIKVLYATASVSTCARSIRRSQFSAASASPAFVAAMITVLYVMRFGWTTASLIL
mmetsp:Transcript_57448/g.133907  ORF Transcript_57448/g.133907 Transcript_57448/m.133907 type:complete len:254 (+) Transcript_57448:134-895(+)